MQLNSQLKIYIKINHLKMTAIHLTIFLCLSFLSCQENANKTVTKLDTDKKMSIGKVDSIFHFKSKVSSILEDRGGNFWIGSKEDGLCKYDGKTYTYFTTNNGLPSNSVPFIQEDKFGNIWLNNGKDISKFDGKQFTVFDKKYILTVDIRKQPIQLSESDLWFGDYGKVGIYRYDGNDLSFISFEDSDLNLKLHYSHFFVSSITKVVNNQIWFGTLTQGAVGFDGKKFERIVDESLNFESEEEFLHIRSMLLDTKGNLWIGNNGVGVILKKENTLYHFSKDQGKLIPMKEFEVNTNKKQFAKNTGLQSFFIFFD
ncbi:MAG: two-component regulator propeller domain-containing protein, partial [Bacteroidota bacterium]